MDDTKENELVDVWDQLPEENPLWFSRFSLYRLIGPSRTIPKAQRKWREMEQKEPTSYNWYDQAKKYRWEERAIAWDEYNRELMEDRVQQVYTSGLSLSHERIAKLVEIAEKLESFILNPKTTRISPFVIEQYRGILDDIAKEKGERTKETRITGVNGGPILIETSWGRGGSASNAWKELPPGAIETTVEELPHE